MSSDKEKAEAFKTSGNAALARNDFPAAIRDYTEAIKLDPTNYVFYSNRAAAYTSCNLLEEAIADAKKTIELQPTWPKGYSRLGTAYTRIGDLENAHEAFDKGLKLAPTDAGLLAGVQHLNGIMRQQQQEVFSTLFTPDLLERVKQDPRTAPLCSQPGFLEMVQSLVQNPSSLGQYRDNPHFPKLFEVILSPLAKPSQAAPSPSTAGSSTSSASTAPAASASTSSDSKDAMDVQQQQQQQQQQEEETVDEEEDEEEKARKERKKQALAAKEEGNALYKALKFDEAIAAYNRAIELDPTEMSFLTNRAAVHFQAGNYEQCIKDCEEAILVGREHRASFGLIARALVRIGNAYYKLENLEAALDAFRRSQTEERSRETAKLINKVEQEKARRDEKAYLNPELALAAKERGNALFKDGKYPEAVAEYSEAIKRDPTQPAYYTNRALTYQKLWEFNKSIEDCDTALELDPNFFKAYTRKGQALVIKKEYHKAIDAFRAGLAIKPDDSELKTGMQRVLYLINQSSGQADPERAKRAMADPEIVALLKDPEVTVVLQQAQTDPTAIQRALGDPKLRAKLEKLVAAGVL